MAEEPSNKKLKVEEVVADKKPELSDDLKQKISNQISYYFSDVNLIKDKFMQEQLKKNDNSVKLSVLATFARLAQLTKDENVMIQALKDLKSDVFEVDEAKKEIKRKVPLPNREEYQKELDARTIHISGFPDFIKFDDLQRFCSNYGKVESLSMRQHYKTKQFKGCIHVVYKDQAEVQKILEGPELTFKDRELRRESMAEYYARKERIKKHRIEKRKNFKNQKGDENRSVDGDNDDHKEEPNGKSNEAEIATEKKEDAKEMKEEKVEGEMKDESSVKPDA